MPLLNGRAYEVKHVRVAAESDGDNAVIAAVAGKKVRVLGFCLNVNAAGVITIQDTNATPVVAASFELADGGSVVYTGGVDCPAFETATGYGLEISNAAGVDTLGFITYQLV